MADDNSWWQSAPLATANGAATAAASGTPKISKQDQEQLAKYRDSADSARQLERAEQEFGGRMTRFRTSPGKDTAFGMMYPDTSGMLGGLKAAGGALLRGTLGYTYSDRDHDDYQYMASRQAALNNAALSLQKGVQTKSDEVRIGRQNVDTARTVRANRDIMRSDAENVTLARARNDTASRWVAKYGSLSGTVNPRGLTYEQWFQMYGGPEALAAANPRKNTQPQKRAPAAPQGWSGFQEVK